MSITELNDTSGTATSRSDQSRQEEAVGISAFATDGNSNLQCVFKQRYTDFQVNEILPSGEVLHLTEIITPPPSKKLKLTAPSDNVNQHVVASAPLKRSNEDGDEAASKRTKLNGGDNDVVLQDNGHTDETVDGPKDDEDAKEPITFELAENDKTTLVELFGTTVTSEILKLYRAILAHPQRKARDHITVKSESIGSKATRTQAHLAIRTIFQSKLETLTLQEEPGRMSIRAATNNIPASNQTLPNDTNAVKKSRINWDELGGNFLHFTLYKENKDTMEVLYFLASQLKVKVNIFSFAGTKDRRGVTVQRVAAYRVTKERLQHLTRLARGWFVGNLKYKKHGLELGELCGNEFIITLRDCRIAGTKSTSSIQDVRKVVEKAALDLGSKGYINYYGLQRFGSFQTGTHVVGMKILQGDLQGAIDCILAYDSAVLPENVDSAVAHKIPQDDIDRADAIRIWRTTQSASKSRDRMPKRFQAESNIIQYLGRKADGHKQDKDWQGALMCIQRGLRLMYVHAYQSFVWNRAAVKRRELYGDCVTEGDLVIIGEKDGSTETVEDKVDQDGEVVIHPSAEDSSGEDAFVRARPLSKAEADSGRWDIFDVVLPLPGWDAILPSNEVGKFYEDFMDSDEGGRLDPHNMRRTWKDASLSGGYRKLMSRPLHGQVEVLNVCLCRGEEQLAETDIDKLRPGQETAIETEGSIADARVGVVLKMQLGSSQYATMALRELTRGGAVAYKPEFSAHR